MKKHSIINQNSPELLFHYSKTQALYFVIFLMLYEISTYVANDMIMPGMINVVHSFSAPDSMVAGSLTAYLLGGASLQLFLGPLSDRFGRRPVMLIGAIFFLLCTLFIAVSQSMESFLIARFFQGMGLCFISVIGYATLQEVFSELYAVRLISLMNNISNLAPLAGPLLGSLIIVALSWRYIFLFIAVAAGISLIGLWKYMPETVGVSRKDGSFVESTSLKPRVIHQNYLALFKNRFFVFGSLAMGLSSVPIISWIGSSPLILMKNGGLSVLEYGLWQIPVFVCSILGSFAMRHHSYSLELSEIIKRGSWVMLLGLLLMPILAWFFKEHYLTIIIGICIYAFGLGYTGGPLNRLTLFSTQVPKGTASALISIIVMAGLALGNQLAGYIYTTGDNFYFAMFLAISGLLYFTIYRFVLVRDSRI